MALENNYKIATYVLIYGVIASIICFAVLGQRVAISFVLGLATAMMNYSLLLKSSRKLLDLHEGSQRGYAVRHSIMRFMIFAAILFIAAADVRFNVIATFVGMLSVKIVYYLYFAFSREV